MSDDGANLEELRRTKRRVLAELDKQVTAFGPHAPAYMLIERKKLQEELGIVESVMRSPLSPSIGDELGPQYSFLANMEQMRELRQALARIDARITDYVEASAKSIAHLEARLTAFVDDSERWRANITRVVVGLLAAIVVALIIGAYWIGRAGNSAFAAQVSAVLVWLER